MTMPAGARRFAWRHAAKWAHGTCGQPGPAMWLDGSASWQPAMRLCATGRQFEQESFAYLRA